MLISISEILDKGWNSYTSKFREFVPYMGLLFVPFLIFGSLGFLMAPLMETGMSPGMTLLVVIAVGLVVGIFFMWCIMALMRATREAIQGQSLSPWKQHLGNVKHLIWPMIYTSILAALIILGGTLLFIIPGIIFGVWYGFVSYAVTLDEKKGMEALRFSKQLVSGRWWAILFRVFVPAFLVSLAAGILQVLLSFAVMALADLIVSDSSVSLLVAQLVSVILNVLLYPLTTLFTVYLYESAKANPVATPASPAPTSPTVA